MKHIFRILAVLGVVAMTMTTGAAALGNETPTTTTTTPTENQTTTEEPLGNQIENAVRNELENRTNTTTSSTASSTSTDRSTATPTPTSPDALDRIDSSTTLVNLSYFPNDEGTGGLAVVTVKSSRYQQIAVTDAMGMSKANGKTGVDIAHKREWVDPGETVRLEIDVTEKGNWAGVIISTDAKLRGYELSKGDEESSPFEQTTSTAGWLGGVTVTGAMVTIAAYRRKHTTYDPVEDVE